MTLLLAFRLIAYGLIAVIIGNAGYSFDTLGFWAILALILYIDVSSGIMHGRK